MATPYQVQLPPHTKGASFKLTFDVTTDLTLTGTRAIMTFRDRNGDVVTMLDSEDEQITVSDDPKQIVTDPAFSIPTAGDISWSLKLYNASWDLPTLIPFAGVWRIDEP